jgi:hypothetical protein
MAVRNDYNGFLLTHPSGLQPWYLIDGGRRRPIPPNVFAKLQKPGRPVRTDIDVESMDMGDVWPEDTMIIGSTDTITLWLYESGKKRGIPSGAIFDDYGFPRGNGIVYLPLAVILGNIPDHPAGEIKARTPFPGG